MVRLFHPHGRHSTFNNSLVASCAETVRRSRTSVTRTRKALQTSFRMCCWFVDNSLHRCFAKYGSMGASKLHIFILADSPMTKRRNSNAKKLDRRLGLFYAWLQYCRGNFPDSCVKACVKADSISRQHSPTVFPAKTL